MTPSDHALRSDPMDGSVTPARGRVAAHAITAAALIETIALAATIDHTADTAAANSAMFWRSSPCVRSGATCTSKPASPSNSPSRPHHWKGSAAAPPRGRRTGRSPADPAFRQRGHGARNQREKECGRRNQPAPGNVEMLIFPDRSKSPGRRAVRNVAAPARSQRPSPQFSASRPGYLLFLAAVGAPPFAAAGTTPPHGSYFTLESGIRSSAALYALSSTFGLFSSALGCS